MGITFLEHSVHCRPKSNFAVFHLGDAESSNCSELDACMKLARTELFSLYDPQTFRRSSTRHRCQ